MQKDTQDYIKILKQTLFTCIVCTCMYVYTVTKLGVKRRVNMGEPTEHIKLHSPVGGINFVRMNSKLFATVLY